jgi:hypothetical protein
MSRYGYDSDANELCGYRFATRDISYWLTDEHRAAGLRLTENPNYEELELEHVKSTAYRRIVARFGTGNVSQRAIHEACDQWVMMQGEREAELVEVA